MHPTKFLKRGALTGSQELERSCWKRGGDFFQEGGGYIKNALKSEVLIDKNSIFTEVHEKRM